MLTPDMPNAGCGSHENQHEGEVTSTRAVGYDDGACTGHHESNAAERARDGAEFRSALMWKRACEARRWSGGPPSMPDSQSTSRDRSIVSSRPLCATLSPDTSARYLGSSARRHGQASR